MDLSTPLSANKNYKLSFYIKKPPPSPDTTMCMDGGNSSITLGISNTPTESGTLIYQSPLGVDEWVQYAVVFNTTNAEQYITVQIDSGATTNNTLFVDNFVLEETTEPATVFVTATNEIDANNKKYLLKIADILGRETKPKKNTLLFYIYNDGTVEKRITID